AFRILTTHDPMSPVPPMTAIFMFSTFLVLGYEMSEHWGTTGVVIAPTASCTFRPPPFPAPRPNLTGTCLPLSARERQQRSPPDGQRDTGGVTKPVARGDHLFEQHE